MIGTHFRISHSKLFIFLLLSVIILISIYPIFHYNLIYGDDIGYHLLRIESIKESIILGQLPAYIHSTAINSYGYGSGLFYPNLFLYFPAILRVIGFSLNDSYKIFLILVSVLNCFSMYFSSKYITKSRYASLCATVLFILSEYRLVDVFKRAAVGEYLALIFIPIVIAGIYDLIEIGFKNPWILGLGFLGLVFSHTITLTIAGIIVCFVCIVNIKKFLRKPMLLLKLFLTASVVLLLSCSYWLPMAEQIMSGKFQFSIPRTYLSENALQFIKLFDLYCLGLGIPLIVFLLLRLFINNRRKHLDKIRISDKYLLLGIIMALLSTTFFPWKILDSTLINNIQMPWRLLTFATLYLSLSIAIVSNVLFQRKMRSIGLAMISIVSIIFAVITLNSYLPNMINGNPSIFSVGAYEWLPVPADFTQYQNPYLIRTDNESSIGADKNGTTVSFNVNTNQTSAYFDVPLLYYKGYSAELIKLDGSTQKLKIILSPISLVRIINPGNLSGRVIVQYTGTYMQKLSVVVNLSTIIFLAIGYGIYKKRIFKSNKKKSIDKFRIS